MSLKLDFLINISLIVYYIDFVMSSYILLIFMCVKFSTLYDREMKVYYVTQVLKQGTNIHTMCPN